MTNPELTQSPGDQVERVHPLIIYPTAFCEGAVVLVIEIVGARALAPFFGSSLQVWTSQITATLLFLALGYGLGGLLARSARRWTLPGLFLTAGIWLSLYPFLRNPILDLSSQHLGVASGSLLSAAALFGVPLLMLGAVSPVLIAHLHRLHSSAGSAAGRLFLTNTLGGLAGGWITALWLIPYTSLRVSLLGTGLLLIALAITWAFVQRAAIKTLAIVLLVAAAGALWLSGPPATAGVISGQRFDLIYNQQSAIGLLQVLKFPDHTQLLINGADQGDMTLKGGYAWNDYIHDLAILGTSHHPQARSALQLGLGAGILPKTQAQRGLKVTVVDIEPKILELARTFFGFPKEIEVHIADAREFLRHDQNTYDLIFLDAFAGESAPWHLLTSEALADMKRHLNPGGRLLINIAAYADPSLPGTAGIESAALSVFQQVLVYPQESSTNRPDELINLIIVAGQNLRPKMVVPEGEASMTLLAKLISNSRAATIRRPIPTDDENRLDYEQNEVRVHFRRSIWKRVSNTLLQD